MTSSNIIEASYKLRSHKVSMLEKFNDIFEEFLELMGDSKFFPFENLNIQLLALHNKDSTNIERSNLNDKIESILSQQNWEIMKKPFSALSFSKKINLHFLSKLNHFKLNNYGDKYTLEYYSSTNEFYLVNNEEERTINILLVLKKKGEKVSKKLKEYRNNFIFEWNEEQNIQDFVNMAKLIVYRSSSINLVHEMFKKQEIEDQKISFFVNLNKKIEKYRILRETSYLLKSTKYVLNNPNLQFLDTYIPQLDHLLNYIVESNFEDFQNSKKNEENIKIFKMNRTTLYYPTYVYEDYR